MDNETANSDDANTTANTEKTEGANRKEYMRELMRRKRAQEKIAREIAEARSGGLDSTYAEVPSEPLPEEVVVNLTRTDRKFENDRPGYYIFGVEVNERECWKCGEGFKTRMELNKFCSVKCKNEWLSDAFGKLRVKA